MQILPISGTRRTCAPPLPSSGNCGAAPNSLTGCTSSYRNRSAAGSALWSVLSSAGAVAIQASLAFRGNLGWRNFGDRSLGLGIGQRTAQEKNQRNSDSHQYLQSAPGIAEVLLAGLRIASPKVMAQCAAPRRGQYRTCPRTTSVTRIMDRGGVPKAGCPCFRQISYGLSSRGVAEGY